MIELFEQVPVKIWFNLKEYEYKSYQSFLRGWEKFKEDHSATEEDWLKFKEMIHRLAMQSCNKGTVEAIYNPCFFPPMAVLVMKET